jgi:hypothetical protein
LTGDNEGKLLVAMFAWDSNSYVGNEYWVEQLSASGLDVDVCLATDWVSGDPAAAACSLVPELLNPDINTSLLGGSALVFATD